MQAHLCARHVCLLLPSVSSHGRRRASSISFVRPTRHFHLIKLDSKGEQEEESAGVDGESGGRRDSLSSLSWLSNFLVYSRLLWDWIRLWFCVFLCFSFDWFTINVIVLRFFCETDLMISSEYAGSLVRVVLKNAPRTRNFAHQKAFCILGIADRRRPFN